MVKVTSLLIKVESGLGLLWSRAWTEMEHV